MRAMGLAKLRRGWPEPAAFTRTQMEDSWDLVDGALGPWRAWRVRELELVGQVRANPDANRRLYRLVSVIRLLRLGLTFDQVAAEIGVTPRHARRLGARSLFIALRRHLVRMDRARERDERAAERRRLRSG